jgi:hypothetical protein
MRLLERDGSFAGLPRLSDIALAFTYGHHLLSQFLRFLNTNTRYHTVLASELIIERQDDFALSSHGACDVHSIIRA